MQNTFTNVLQLPLQTIAIKPKRPWEPRELEFEPAPAGKKRKPVGKPDSKKTTKQNREPKRKASRARKSDKTLKQIAVLEGLVSGHVEGAVQATIQAWHPQEQEKPEKTMEPKRPVIQESQTQLKTSQAMEQPEKQELQLHDGVDESTLSSAEKIGVVASARLTVEEGKLNEPFAKHRYHYPRVFVLLSHIAYLAELANRYKTAKLQSHPSAPGEPSRVATERLLSRAKDPSTDVRRALYRNLQMACEMKFINKVEGLIGDRTVTTWELAHEGKLFLLAGIKVRNGMRKITTDSDERICCAVSADEIEDWKLDAEERALRLIKDFGFDKKCGVVTAPDMSRTELAKAIEKQAVEKMGKSGIHNLWSGLVR